MSITLLIKSPFLSVQFYKTKFVIIHHQTMNIVNIMISLQFVCHNMNNNENGGFYAEMVVQISRLSEIISDRNQQLQ